MAVVGGLMKSRADWGNRQGNSERCFLYFLNEINDLVCHFEFHQPPQNSPLEPTAYDDSEILGDKLGTI